MRVAIIGRSEILYDTAERLRRAGHDIAIIVTAVQAPEYSRTVEDFDELARTWQIPFVKTSRISDASEIIRSQHPIDIGVSFNYSGIIPASVIELFRLGILNAHGGDLPRYRGNACQAWAILNGEDRIGLCIHRMIGGELDTGDIIEREYFPIDARTKVTATYRWMSERIPVLFLRALSQLQNNPDYVLEKQSTDPRDILRCYPRRPEDGRISWNSSASAVVRLVNACNKPYAGAFFFLRGTKVTVWDGSPIEDGEAFCAIPGQITCIDAEALEVACGSGKVRLWSLEVDGVTTAPTALAHSLRERCE